MLRLVLLRFSGRFSFGMRLECGLSDGLTTPIKRRKLSFLILFNTICLPFQSGLRCASSRFISGHDWRDTLSLRLPRLCGLSRLWYLWVRSLIAWHGSLHRQRTQLPVLTIVCLSVGALRPILSHALLLFVPHLGSLLLHVGVVIWVRRRWIQAKYPSFWCLLLLLLSWLLLPLLLRLLAR